MLTELSLCQGDAYRKLEYIEDAINYEYYDSVVPEGGERELVEICTPIKLGDQVPRHRHGGHKRAVAGTSIN